MLHVIYMLFKLQRFKDEWHTLFSDSHSRIADYLSHMKSVMSDGEQDGNLNYS